MTVCVDGVGHGLNLSRKLGPQSDVHIRLISFFGLDLEEEIKRDFLNFRTTASRSGEIRAK